MIDSGIETTIVTIQLRSSLRACYIHFIVLDTRQLYSSPILVRF
jgi:hypothetical protein